MSDDFAGRYFHVTILVVTVVTIVLVAIVTGGYL